MKDSTYDKRLQRATQRVSILERMLEEKTRELFLEKENLRQKNDFLRKILHTSLFGIVVCDNSFIITFVNTAAQKVLGESQAELAGSRIDKIFPVEVFGADCEADDMSLVDGFRDEVILTRQDGALAVVFVSISVLWDEQGQSAGLVCMMEDVSDRKQLERTLLQSQKLEAVGQLAAGIAHEINTPIQYIRDNMQFFQNEFLMIRRVLEHYVGLEASAQSGIVSKKDIEYLVQEIPLAIEQTLQGAESVAQIVRSMKQLSHPGSTEATYVDIHSCLDTVITVSRNEWKYVAEVEREYAEKLPSIVGFTNELNQAFLNMLVNAAHAIGEKNEQGKLGKGKIIIRTHANDENIVVEIEDTGTGMSPEIQRKIFDPFFTTKEVGKGTGQGLAIVHSTIVARHRGSVEIESEVGKGSIFRITFPHDQKSSGDNKLVNSELGDLVDSAQEISAAA